MFFLIYYHQSNCTRAYPEAWRMCLILAMPKIIFFSLFVKIFDKLNIKASNFHWCKAHISAFLLIKIMASPNEQPTMKQKMCVFALHLGHIISYFMCPVKQLIHALSMEKTSFTWTKYHCIHIHIWLFNSPTMSKLIMNKEIEGDEIIFLNIAHSSTGIGSTMTTLYNRMSFSRARTRGSSFDSLMNKKFDSAVCPYSMATPWSPANIVKMISRAQRTRFRGGKEDQADEQEDNRQGHQSFGHCKRIYSVFSKIENFLSILIWCSKYL